MRPKRRMQIQAGRLRAILKLDPATMFRIPGFQAERQECLKMGLTWFTRGIHSSVCFDIARHELQSALAIEKTDCVALFHLGLIHLCIEDYADLEKAETCLFSAGRYASAEYTPKRSRLFELLTADPEQPEAPERPSVPAIQRFAVEAFILAAECSERRGIHVSTLHLLDRALALYPGDPVLRFQRLKPLCLLGRGSGILADLELLIDSDASFYTLAEKDPVLSATSAVSSLLTGLRLNAIARLRATVEAATRFLLAHSQAASFLDRLRALLATGSYKDARAGYDLAERIRFDLDGESLGLHDFLQREHRILTESIPSLRTQALAILPRSPEVEDLKGRLLGELDRAGAADFHYLHIMYNIVSIEEILDSVEDPLLRWFCQRLGQMASARLRDRSALERLKSQGRSTIVLSYRSTLDQPDPDTSVVMAGSLTDLVGALRSMLAAGENQASIPDNGVSSPGSSESAPDLQPSETASQQSIRGLPRSAPAHNVPGVCHAAEILTIPVEGGSLAMANRFGVHTVHISSYGIGVHPVTEAQYLAVMGGSRYHDPDGPETGKWPVSGVCWYDAVSFCNRLSVLDGREPVYTIRGCSDPDRWIPTHTCLKPIDSWDRIRMDATKNGYRLPTEAEWEYAARGGLFSKGYLYAGSDDIDAVAWYEGNSGQTLHEVGTKAPNELGLYDMSGNVEEWCWDCWATYPEKTLTDPVGPALGTFRICRGGSFDTVAGRCGTGYRSFHTPDSPSRGFRLAHRI